MKHRVLFDFGMGERSFVDMIDKLTEDKIIIEWSQADGSKVRSSAQYQGDSDEHGYLIYVWDGTREPVPDTKESGQLLLFNIFTAGLLKAFLHRGGYWFFE